MQRKFGKDGFVLVAVSIDDPADKDARGEIDKFLTQQRPDFKNYIMASSEDEWSNKLGINGPPCLYLFDRDNFAVKKYLEEPDMGKLEAEIEKLLKE